MSNSRRREYQRPRSRIRRGGFEYRERSPSKKYEDYAYVLDIIPVGIRKNQTTPILQAIGTRYFTLLEIIPLPDAKIEILEKIGIGKDTREKVKTISERINMDKLTTASLRVLEEAVCKIVEENERRFVEFFNKAQPITIKMHSLELIPGIGKKTMKQILEERKEIPFLSFQDISERVHIPDPKKLVVKRILEELEGNEKYYLFTRGSGQKE